MSDVITLEDGGDIRAAITALEFAALRPVEERKIAVVHEVIAALRDHLADNERSE